MAVDILPHLEAEAKQRQLATQNNNAGRSVQQLIAEQENGQARDKAADAVGTNRQYISDAKKLQAEAPALAAQVRAGGKQRVQGGLRHSLSN